MQIDVAVIVCRTCSIGFPEIF